MPQIAVKIGGHTYVVNTGVSAGDFEVLDTNFDPVQVSTDVAAKLYAAAKAWAVLEKLLGQDVLVHESSTWGDVQDAAETVVGLEGLSSVIGAASGLVLRTVIGFPPNPAAQIDVLAGSLIGMTGDGIVLTLTSVGIADATRLVGQVNAAFDAIAMSVRSGVPISYEEINGFIDQCIIAMNAGRIMRDMAAEIGNFGQSWVGDLQDWFGSFANGLFAEAGATRPLFDPRIVDLLGSIDTATTFGEAALALRAWSDLSYHSANPEIGAYDPMTDTGLGILQHELLGSSIIDVNLPGHYLGTGGNDTLRGGSSNDTFGGGDGNDTFNGRGGSDEFYGGAGSDTVIFDEQQSAYVLSRENGTGVYLVRHVVTGDVDRLSGVEYVRFGPAATTAVTSLNWNGAVSPPPPPPTVPSPAQPAPPPAPGDDYGNTAATAHAISSNSALAGVIGARGDQDWFAVTLQAGTQYSFSMAGGSYGGISGLASPHLYLVNAAGDVLAHGAPVSTNSIFQFTPPSTGTYYLQARANGDQGVGAYGIGVTPLGPAPSPPAPGNHPLRLDLDAVEDVRTEDGDQLVYRVEAHGDLTEDIVIGWTLTPRGDHPIDALDVTAMSGTVTLRANDSDGYVNIRINPEGDSVDEFDETFGITIHVVSGNATISDDDAWGTILNDDEGLIHPDIDEHSNTSVGATPLVEDVWSRGFITTPGDLDYFGFQTVAGTTYEIVIVGDDDTSIIDGDEDGFVELYDPQGAVYDANGNQVTGQFVAPINQARATYQFTAATSGTYFVAVREDGNNDIGQYFVRVEVTSHADDYAANSSTTANLLEGQLGMALNERTGDVDWFRVQLNAGETYSFFAVDTGLNGTYVWPAGSREFEVRVLDANGNSLAGATEPDGINNGQYNQVTFTAATSGTYFIQVSYPDNHSSDIPYVVGFDSVAAPPPGTPTVFQPGPAQGHDATWRNVTSQSEPGVDNDTLNVGGFWTGAGNSAAALMFDLNGLPSEASEAYIEIYLYDVTYSGADTTRPPISMLLGANLAAWSESDTYATIRDYQLESWLSAPAGEGWYRIEITDLYNAWQSGELANYGISLLPVDTHTTQNAFYSSDYSDPSLRPRLVVYDSTPGNVTGTQSYDSLTGSDRSDFLRALGGDDLISAGGGSDILDGGAGADLMDGGSGYDLASYADSIAGVYVDLGRNEAAGGYAAGDSLLNIERLLGSVFGDTLIGDGGDNVLRGEGGDDVLSGAGASDVLVGGLGADLLDGGAGNDWMDAGDGDDVLVGGGGGINTLLGGAGFDVLSFEGQGSGVYVNLLASAYSYAGGYDGLSSIEGVRGTSFADTIFGDNSANLLRGGSGNDTLVGRGGSDTLLGEAGDDWIVGEDGNDVLEGGVGINVLLGGTGIDLASYASATAPLWVNMAAGVYSASGVWDVFFESIEGVRGGSGNDSLFGNTSDNRLEGMNGDDALIGDLGNDTLVGGDGSDWIVGGDGNDRLVGGNGVDVLTGGNGADIFDLGTAAGWDVAFDFNTAQDRFQLGGLQWLGFLTIDADGDGQTDDTLLGYAGGNFVALNVSGLTLSQWNALVDAPGAEEGAEKFIADGSPEVRPIGSDIGIARAHGFYRGHGFDFGVGLDAATRGYRPEDPFLLQDGPTEWGTLAA